MGNVWIPGMGGGGTSSDELTATRNDVLKGKTAITSDSNDEPVEGTLELTGDAADSHVLTGKTYYNKDPKTRRAGTMPNHGAVAQELAAGGSYTVPEGYHNGGGKVTAKSLASQTEGATAADGDVLSGKTYWKDGAKRTGSMADYSTGSHLSNSVTLDTKYKEVKVQIPKTGKYSDASNVYVTYGYLAGAMGLTADKIKKGETILGVTGTYTGYCATTHSLTKKLYELKSGSNVINQNVVMASIKIYQGLFGDLWCVLHDGQKEATMQIKYDDGSGRTATNTISFAINSVGEFSVRLESTVGITVSCSFSVVYAVDTMR